MAEGTQRWLGHAASSSQLPLVLLSTSKDLWQWNFLLESLPAMLEMGARLFPTGSRLVLSSALALLWE